MSRRRPKNEKSTHIWDHPAFTTISRYNAEPHPQSKEEALIIARTILEKGTASPKPWELLLETCSPPKLNIDTLAWETICMTKHGYHAKITTPIPTDMTTTTLIITLKLLAKHQNTGKRTKKQRKHSTPINPKQATPQPKYPQYPLHPQNLRKNTECLKNKYPDIHQFLKIRGLEHTIICLEE